MNELQKLWDGAWHAAQERQWLYGRLGFLSSDAQEITLRVPHRKDFVYVRMGLAGDNGVNIARLKPNVPLRPNLPVRMRKENGVLVVYEADSVLMEGDQDILPDGSGVPVHYHALGDLSNVSTTGALADQVLTFDGNNWVPANPSISSLNLLDLADTPTTYEPHHGQFVLVKEDETGIEFSETPNPLYVNMVQAWPVSHPLGSYGIMFYDQNNNPSFTIHDDNNLEIPGEFARLAFTGTVGGDDEGIYWSSHSPDFTTPAFWFPGGGVVAISNRVASGKIEIRPSNATGGELGETTAAVFEHDQIQLLPSGGNVGIGTTDIKTWFANYSALQLGRYGSFMFGVNAGYTGFTMMSNMYRDAAGDWRRREAFGATNINVSHASVSINVTGTGAAGSTFTPLNAVYVDGATGNVGIGTTSPAEMLEIEGADPAIRLEDTDVAGMYGRIGGGGGSLVLAADEGNVGGGSAMAFRVDGTERMRIATTGNVGIGHSNPTAKLDVRQTSTTDAIPVLTLVQSDSSEEFINFGSSVGAGNPIQTSALGAYYGKIRVAVNGVFKYIPLYDS